MSSILYADRLPPVRPDPTVYMGRKLDHELRKRGLSTKGVKRAKLERLGEAMTKERDEKRVLGVFTKGMMDDLEAGDLGASSWLSECAKDDACEAAAPLSGYETDEDVHEEIRKGDDRLETAISRVEESSSEWILRLVKIVQKQDQHIQALTKELRSLKTRVRQIQSIQDAEYGQDSQDSQDEDEEEEDSMFAPPSYVPKHTQ